MSAQPRNVSVDVRRLPIIARDQIAHAKLPANYETAKRALQVCVNIDECKDIADKHSAIAHYAKQIQDKTLLHYAERIYLRAQARLGELLSEITDRPARIEAGKKSGLSAAAIDSAINISRIPRKARDRVIETDPPPTKSALSFQGSKLSPRARDAREQRFSRWASDIEFRATPYGKVKEIFVSLLAQINADNIDGRHWDEENTNWLDPGQLASRLTKDEADLIRKPMQTLIDWLDEFERVLPKSNS